MAASHMDTPASQDYNAPVSSSNHESKGGINMEYAKGVYGLIKLAQFGNCFLAFFIAVFFGGVIWNIFFILVMLAGFLLSLAVYLMFLFGWYKRSSKVNWFTADLIISGVGAVVLFIFSIGNVFVNFVPAVFGFIAAISFAVSAWLAFRRWSENRNVTNTKTEYQVEY